MKALFKQEIKAIILTLLVTLLLIFNMSAQTPIVVDSFSKVKIEGPVTVFLNKAENTGIIVEKGSENKNTEELFQYSVQNGVLEIKATGKAKDLEICVNYVTLDEVYAAGISNIKTRNPLKSENLLIKSEGATDLDMEIGSGQLELDASAATTVKLRGTTDNAKVVASGAADIRAMELVAETANIESGGAADVQMDVVRNATIQASGASNVKLRQEPEVISVDLKGASELKYGDTVVESDILDILSDSIMNDTPKKFDGNWGGVELGLNFLVDKQLNSGFQTEYEFLELNQPKSLTVQLNLIEYNIPIVRNNFGIVTGLGLWINNYRFDNNIILVSDSVQIFGYADTTWNYTKSKLTTSYLTLPIIFEYQVRDKRGKEVLHIGAGAYGGVKLGSKSKTVYVYENTKIKTKDNNDFKLNPFKYGLTARIGWRKLNFFANYNLSELFESNKGPEIYPFEVGITLVGW